MKKIKLSLCVSIMFICKSLFADDFIDMLHFLAVYSACLGQYSATQAGETWKEDPKDYYTPQDIADFLADMSGERTKTDTFYGICFDYANHAYDFIDANTDDFAPGGIREKQFFIAISAEDSNIIELSSPVSAEEGMKKWNGVSVKTNGADSYKNVKNHGDCTYHAWLWIQRYDGVWFWIDPTWTDNCGYVFYGYVGNGREIQCRPDKDWCAEYPSVLNVLPNPPEVGKIINSDKDPVLVDEVVSINDDELYYWKFTVPKGSECIGINCSSDAMVRNIMSFAVVSSEDAVEKFYDNCLGNKETFLYIPGSYKTNEKTYSVALKNLKPGKTYYFCAYKAGAFFSSTQYVLETIITW